MDYSQTSVTITLSASIYPLDLKAESGLLGIIQIFALLLSIKSRDAHTFKIKTHMPCKKIYTNT